MKVSEIMYPFTQILQVTQRSISLQFRLVKLCASMALNENIGPPSSLCGCSSLIQMG